MVSHPRSVRRLILSLGTLCAATAFGANSPAPAPAAPSPAAPAQTPAAAADTSADEARALKDLQNLFDEGLFEKADGAAKAFLQKFPASPLRAQARFLQGKALYFLGRYEPAAAALRLDPKDTQANADLAPDLLFWLGEVETGLENWPEAEKAYRACLAQAGAASALAPKAQLGLAWTLYKEGNAADAKALLGALMQATPPVEAGEKAALVLAKIQIADNQPDEAAKTLDALAQRKVRPAAAFESAYWRGEIAQLRKDWPAAIQYYRVITDDSKAFPGALVAQAWFGLGSAYQKTGDNAHAMQALEQAFTLGASEQIKLASFRRYLEAAAALQRLPQAQAKLRDFAQKDKSPVTASAALLAIASSQADNGASDEAIGTLEALLTASPQTDWRAAALFQLGQLYTDKGKPDQALASLQGCLDSNPPPAMARQAEFKTAEIWSAKGDDAKAADFFQKATAPGSPAGVAEKAWVNLLLCQARLGALDPFLKTQADFAKAFPQSPFLGKAALELAGLYEKAGQADKARAVYQDALKTADASQKPLLLLKLADLLRRGGQYDDAFALYNQVVTDFKDDARVPDAAYGAIWTGNLAGRYTRDQTREQLLQLEQRFPQSPLAPTLLFEVAEFHYDQQDYVDAQTRFEQVAKGLPAEPAGAEGALLRGRRRAASQRFPRRPADPGEDPRGRPGQPQDRGAPPPGPDLPGAGEVRERPGPLRRGALHREDGPPLRRRHAAQGGLPLRPGRRRSHALRAGGERLRHPPHLHPGRLRAAQRGGLQAGPVLGEAGPGPGRAAALPRRPQRAHPAPRRPAPPPDFLWRVKAGHDAAELRKQQQDWRGAVDIYQRLESLGGPTQAEFRDAVTRLRREHFLFDDADAGADAGTATNSPAANAPAPAPANAAPNAPAAAPASPAPAAKP